VVFCIGFSIALLMGSGLSDALKVGVIGMGTGGLSGGIIGYQLGKNYHIHHHQSGRRWDDQDSHQSK